MLQAVSLPLINQKGPASALPRRLGRAAGADAEATVLGAAPGARLGGAVPMRFLSAVKASSSAIASLRDTVVETTASAYVRTSHVSHE